MLGFALELASELRWVVEEALEDEDAGKVASRGSPESKKVDLVAEEFLLEALGELPLHIVTEETGVHRSSSEPEKIAVIDPIDGSYNALHGIPFYSLSIAFAPYSENAELGDVDTAMVMNLATGKYFYAERGKGSFFMRERIEVVDKPLEEGALSIYSTAGDIEALLPLLGRVSKVRTLGSAALELCYLARGDFQAFVDNRERLRNVDIAAGLLVLEEAGGVASDTQGRALRNGILGIESLSILAAPPEAHTQVLSLLQR